MYVPFVPVGLLFCFFFSFFRRSGDDGSERRGGEPKGSEGRGGEPKGSEGNRRVQRGALRLH
jgi:hypothetical protein